MSGPFDDLFKDAEVISTYGWEQGVEDGMLSKVFESRWKELSGGKPILATASVMAEFSPAALREMWNDFVVWRTTVMPTLASSLLCTTKRSMGMEGTWLRMAIPRRVFSVKLRQSMKWRNHTHYDSPACYHGADCRHQGDAC